MLEHDLMHFRRQAGDRAGSRVRSSLGILQQLAVQPDRRVETVGDEVHVDARRAGKTPAQEARRRQQRQAGTEREHGTPAESLSAAGTGGHRSAKQAIQFLQHR